MDGRGLAHVWLVAAHTIVVYFSLMFMLRLTGRRQLGQLNGIDLLVVLLLGSAVETSMVAGNTTLPAGIISAATLLLCNLVVSLLLTRSKRLRHLVNHGPVLLVHDGQMVQEHLKRLGLTEADVMEALRERECANLRDVRFAVMESDGEIHVILSDRETIHDRRPLARGAQAG